MTTEHVIHVGDTYVAINTVEDGQRTKKVVMPFEDLDPKIVKSVQSLVEKLLSVDEEILGAKQAKRAREANERKALAEHTP